MYSLFNQLRSIFSDEPRPRRRLTKSHRRPASYSEGQKMPAPQDHGSAADWLISPREQMQRARQMPTTSLYVPTRPVSADWQGISSTLVGSSNPISYLPRTQSP